MSDTTERPTPVPLLRAIGLLLTVVIVMVAVVRLSAGVPQWTPEGAVVDSRDIRFVDKPGGVIAAYDAKTNALAASYSPGADGFVRVALRGMAHERRTRGIGSEPAFRLSRMEGGELALTDLATGRHIFLNAFGYGNAASFERLLSSGKATQ